MGDNHVVALHAVGENGDVRNSCGHHAGRGGVYDGVDDDVEGDVDELAGDYVDNDDIGDGDVDVGELGDDRVGGDDNDYGVGDLGDGHIGHDDVGDDGCDLGKYDFVEQELGDYADNKGWRYWCLCW